MYHTRARNGPAGRPHFRGRVFVSFPALVPRSANVIALERVLSAGLWVGFFLILLTPFIISSSTLFPYIVGKALYSRTIIELLLVLWAVLALLNPTFRPSRSWILILLGVSLAVGVLAAFLGVSPVRSFWSNYERMQGVVDQAHWLVFAVMLYAVLRDAAQWRVYLNLGIAVSVVIALLAIAQEFSLEDVPGLGRLATGDGRHSATLGNPLYLGLYGLLNSFIAAGFLVRSFVSGVPRRAGADGQMQSSERPAPSARDRRAARGRNGRGEQARARAAPAASSISSGAAASWIDRSFWGVAIVVNLWALGLTGARGAALGFVAGLGVVALAYLWLARSRWIRLVATGGVVLMFLVAAGGTFFMLYGDRLGFERSDDVERGSTLFERLLDPSANYGVRTRIAAWEAGWKGFLDRPLLGWGPENYIVPFGRHATGLGAKMKIHDHAHNKVVEELVTRGLLGLLSYLAIWTALLWVFIRAVKRMEPGDRALTIFIGGALAGYFAQNLTSIDAAASLLQWSILLAFVAHLERELRKSAAQTEAGEEASASPVTARGSSGESWFGRGQWGPLVRYHGVWAVLVACALSTAVAGAWTHRAMLTSASITKVAILSTSDRRSTSELRRYHFERAMESFPPLANLPRLIFFQYVKKVWGALRQHDRKEAARLLAVYRREARAAVEAEPENWRLWSRLAWTYNIIAHADARYVGVTRQHVERAEKLAPRRKQIAPDHPAPGVRG